ncbi:hypothetical protein L596_017762 [Steinernema carpocapsae]|uniref:Uncharacterized protein n=1 Tax=Steinernema carpocapsae TaxID=34508 RepID=A0A4U5N3E5_STECR|nr:hypothetical protein L596_017762 [Steinernema carpocapsae]
MTSSGVDTGLNPLLEIFDDRRECFQADFIPCGQEIVLQVFHGGMSSSAGFLLQYGPNCKVHWIQIRRIGGPH